MKISELIKVLENRLNKHGDLEVMTTWESVTQGLDASEIYKSHNDSLYIDADGNSYKRAFAADPTEGDDGA